MPPFPARNDFGQHTAQRSACQEDEKFRFPGRSLISRAKNSRRLRNCSQSGLRRTLTTGGIREYVLNRWQIDCFFAEAHQLCRLNKRGFGVASARLLTRNANFWSLKLSGETKRVL